VPLGPGSRSTAAAGFRLRPLVALAAWLTAAPALAGAGYSYQLACGTPTDAPSATAPAAMLIGGAEAGTAGEPAATEWFLERGAGGDYLVLRSGGTGAQAAWLCSAFPDRVASAAELSVDTPGAADDPAVRAYVDQAEMLFIAGGDQSAYVELWRDTELEAAINDHLAAAPVAGTSAGMAVLGSAYYAPQTLGILPSELLDDPFDPLSQHIGQGDFLAQPLLDGVITDTHLDRTHGPGDEFRYGRLFGLLARLTALDPVVGRELAIGAEEGVFIAIDADGSVQAFGPEGSAAWFAMSSRRGPEVLTAGAALVWQRGQRAVRAFRLPATPEGRAGFDLGDPVSASGGQWYAWYTGGGWTGFNFADGSCAVCAGVGPPPRVSVFGDAFESPD
jgi:cyanophycinase-like exopeptidase